MQAVTDQIDQTPIDVETALAGSEYEKEAKKLAEQFAKARIEIKGMVQNAPLRLKKTFGVDIYKAMALIMKYEVPPELETRVEPAQKRPKKASK